VFQELRAGVTKDGKTKIKPPTASLSTAEAISVLFQSSILAQCFGGGTVTAADVARSLVSAVSKDGSDDLGVVREYAETVAKGRPGKWKELHAALRGQLGGGKAGKDKDE